MFVFDFQYPSIGKPFLPSYYSHERQPLVIFHTVLDVRECETVS